METRRLEYFVRIVDAGSITKAAAQIGIAQPALSQQLGILEAEFKARLLHRTSQGIVTTAAGADLYRHARIILRQLEQAHQLVSDASQKPAGPVSLGLPTTSANLLTIPILEAVRTRFPDVHLKISEGVSGMLTELVLNARLDMSLLFLAGPMTGLQVEPLWIEDLLLIAPAEAELPKKMSIAEAARLPLLMPAQGNGSRNVLNALLARHDLTPNVVADIDSTLSLKRAVEKGLGYTFLPWAAVHEEVGSDRLSVTAVDEPAMVRTVSLCSPSAMPVTAASDCLTAIIRQQVEELLTRRNVPGIRAPS
ncbi:LysR substrate-binding domain-containing protein [Variovorax sp. LjRoot290]|uniref:LysR substrate-binding domain-containing protein n=1 Tax=Variovorax sp. LjRoot290 TaxID=3342316 RepID=UPI003ECE84A0